jgi:hypothetical protein
MSMPLRGRLLTTTAMTAIATILDQPAHVEVFEEGRACWDLVLLFREDGTRRTRWMRAPAKKDL